MNTTLQKKLGLVLTFPNSTSIDLHLAIVFWNIDILSNAKWFV